MRHQNVINLLTLRCQTQSASGQATIELLATGRLAANASAVERLLRTRVAVDDQRLLAAEHSIGELMRFVAS